MYYIPVILTLFRLPPHRERNDDSVQSIAEGLDAALIVALVGAPDTYLEANRLQRLSAGSGHAAEKLIHGGSRFLMWRNDAPLAAAAMPSDWKELVGTTSESRVTDALHACMRRHHARRHLGLRV